MICGSYVKNLKRFLMPLPLSNEIATNSRTRLFNLRVELAFKSYMIFHIRCICY